MSSGIVRIGVVGCGAISRNAHLPVLLSFPSVKVVWLADTNQRSGQALSKASGVRFHPIPGLFETVMGKPLQDPFGERAGPQPAGRDGFIGIQIHDPVENFGTLPAREARPHEGYERRRGQGDHHVRFALPEQPDAS